MNSFSTFRYIARCCPQRRSRPAAAPFLGLQVGAQLWKSQRRGECEGAAEDDHHCDFVDRVRGGGQGQFRDERGQAGRQHQPLERHIVGQAVADNRPPALRIDLRQHPLEGRPAAGGRAPLADIYV